MSFRDHKLNVELRGVKNISFEKFHRNCRSASITTYTMGPTCGCVTFVVWYLAKYKVVDGIDKKYFRLVDIMDTRCHIVNVTFWMSYWHHTLQIGWYGKHLRAINHYQNPDGISTCKIRNYGISMVMPNIIVAEACSKHVSIDDY